MTSRVQVGAILAVGAGLRLIGMKQGYPDFYGHVDEIGVAASIWNFFREATLHPTEFTYPAFFQYLVALGVTVAGGWVAPALADATYLDRLRLLSYTDPGLSVLVGRGISILADLIHIALIYQLIRRVGAGSWAWFGALSLAVAVISVRQAHMALPDATVAMLSTLAIFYAVKILQEEGYWRDYLVAGVVCGLVLATKYNGALCALAVLAAHLLRHGDVPVWRRIVEPRLLGAGTAAVAAALLACPYFLLAPEQYLGLARYQLSSLDFALRETSPWWWIARDWVLAEHILGGLLLAGAVGGLARRDRVDWLALAAIVPAFAYIGSWTKESLHYLLPYLGILIVQATRFLAHVESRLPRSPAWLLPGLAILALIPNGASSLQNSLQLHLTDTRTRAAEWIQQTIPDGTGIGMTWLPYCPRLPSIDDRHGLLVAYATSRQAQQLLQTEGRLSPAYRIVNLEVWLKEPVVPEALRAHVDLDDQETRRVFSRGWQSPRQLRQSGVQYVVLPDGAYARYLNDDAQPSSLAALYRQRVNRAYFELLLDPSISQTVAVFDKDVSTRGGEIRVLRLRDSARDATRRDEDPER